MSGHVDNTAYDYYVRCINSLGNANLDDYAISFTLEDTPTIPVSTGQTGGSSTTFVQGGGGSGTIPGGANTLYLANVTLAGFAPPNTSVRILKDGTVNSTVQVSALGVFQGTVTNLERGTYSFAVYGIDSAGRESSLYYTTLTVGVGTANALTNIILPPTVALTRQTVGLNEDAEVVGSSIASSTVEVLLTAQGSGGLGSSQRFTTTIPAGGTGAYRIPVKTTGLPAGTYLVRARTIYNGQESNYSRLTFLGVGEVVDPGFGIRADLNKDGKVNLVDFSIMLTAWNTPNANADINEDGRVGLADFSILLFNWTG